MCNVFLCVGILVKLRGVVAGLLYQVSQMLGIWSGSYIYVVLGESNGSLWNRNGGKRYICCTIYFCKAAVSLSHFLLQWSCDLYF